MKREHDLLMDDYKTVFHIDFLEGFTEKINNITPTTNYTSLGSIDPEKGQYFKTRSKGKYLTQYDMSSTSFFQNIFAADEILITSDVNVNDWTNGYTWGATYVSSFHVNDSTLSATNSFIYPRTYSQGAPNNVTILPNSNVSSTRRYVKISGNQYTGYYNTSNNEGFETSTVTFNYTATYKYVRIGTCVYGNNTFFDGWIKNYKIMIK